jgi:hypothetical protein
MLSKSFSLLSLVIGTGTILLTTACEPEQKSNNPSPTPCPEVITCTPKSIKTKIYVAASLTKQEEVTTAKNFFYSIAKQTGDATFIVDTLEGKNIANHFSSDEANRRLFHEFSSHLTVKPSDPDALIQAFNRMLEIADKNPQDAIYGYILSSGTSDPIALNSIREISSAFAKKKNKPVNLRLHIVGISPVHRLEMSKAIAPIDQYIKFSGALDSEWTPLVQALNN